MQSGVRTLSVLALTFALAACESPDVLDAVPDETPETVSPHDAGPAPISGTTTYACAGGDSFTATPLDGGARLELARGADTLTLGRIASDAGARYAKGDTQVWISQDGAFVVENEVMVLADCSAAP